ncbi:MAG: BON domain-containing protein [Chloroflexota bacterium]
MTILLPLTKDDAELQANVLAEIARDPRFRPAEIGVEVDSGVVTLTGTVSSYPKLAAAAEIAAEIAGVKGVANDLTLEMSSAFARTDTELVAAIRETLRWDVDVPDEKVEIIVRNGRVTLKGTVEYWYERVAAVKAVERLSGVVAVSDQVAVKPQRLADAAVAAEIGEAIARRTSGANRIAIDVKVGAVTLRGGALTPHDRFQAEKAAWSTKGVRTVINEIDVTW